MFLSSRMNALVDKAVWSTTNWRLRRNKQRAILIEDGDSLLYFAEEAPAQAMYIPPIKKLPTLSALGAIAALNVVNDLTGLSCFREALEDAMTKMNWDLDTMKFIVKHRFFTLQNTNTPPKEDPDPQDANKPKVKA